MNINELWNKYATGIPKTMTKEEFLPAIAEVISSPVDQLVMRKITDITNEALDYWKTKIINYDGGKTDTDELCEKIADMQVNNFAVYLLQKINESNFSA